jgi:hypothetical protein
MRQGERLRDKIEAQLAKMPSRRMMIPALTPAQF